MYKPVILVVLDGWGLGQTEKGNPIAKATLPTIDDLNKNYPHIALEASGISVGLPWGEAGNSEVGHITLGSGKIVFQNMPKITLAIQTREFFNNEYFLEAIQNSSKKNSNLHLIGLLGKGAVHSHTDHIYALLELIQKHNLKKVFLHIFTDGRDSSPTDGVECLKELQKKINDFGIGKIASISGRYYSMDRNNNWDRTAEAYNAIVKGEGKKIEDSIKYLTDCYAKESFDEFIKPAVVIENGQPVATVKENDSVIFFNFREDRARQLTKAFVLPDFKEFPREFINNLYFVTMTEYEKNLPAKVAFPPSKITAPLGKTLSVRGLKQLRIAETEKFAHVTYFFNSGIETIFLGEDRVIVPSSTVSTFDKEPEMKAQEITDRVIASLDRYDFILMNYANPDMVAHTGNEEATIKAVETVDQCLSQLIPKVLEKSGALLITADHGNAEEVSNSMTGEIETEHSANPVPCWFITPENRSPQVNSNFENIKPQGILSDVAPTILELLGIPKPQEMTGESLLSLLK